VTPARSPQEAIGAVLKRAGFPAGNWHDKTRGHLVGAPLLGEISVTYCLASYRFSDEDEAEERSMLGEYATTLAAAGYHIAEKRDEVVVYTGRPLRRIATKAGAR
jgi:hypothetical protein